MAGLPGDTEAVGHTLQLEGAPLADGAACEVLKVNAQLSAHEEPKAQPWSVASVSGARQKAPAPLKNLPAVGCCWPPRLALVAPNEWLKNQNSFEPTDLRPPPEAGASQFA